MIPPRVFAIVLNYCSLEDTVQCVDMIRRSSHPNTGLLVIDNASPDHSGSALSGLLPPSEFLQMHSNTGYAQGNNVGIARALAQNAEYVLVVNPDVRLPAEAIAHYVAVMQADKSIGALNSVQTTADGSTVDANFLAGVLRPSGFPVARLSPGALPTTFEATELFGAALMLSRDALERVGGFDPMYFAYGEDLDLCRRLRAHGFKLVVTSAAPVVHLRTKESSGMARSVVYLRLRGSYLSMVKNPRHSFRHCVLHTLRELAPAAVGSPPSRYPFTYLCVDRRIAARTLAWFIMNVPRIWLHRARERRGRCYI